MHCVLPAVGIYVIAKVLLKDACVHGNRTVQYSAYIMTYTQKHLLLLLIILTTGEISNCEWPVNPLVDKQVKL